VLDCSLLSPFPDEEIVFWWTGVFPLEVRFGDFEWGFPKQSSQILSALRGKNLFKVAAFGSREISWFHFKATDWLKIKVAAFGDREKSWF